MGQIQPVVMFYLTYIMLAFIGFFLFFHFKLNNWPTFKMKDIVHIDPNRQITLESEML